MIRYVGGLVCYLDCASGFLGSGDVAFLITRGRFSGRQVSVIATKGMKLTVTLSNQIAYPPSSRLPFIPYATLEILHTPHSLLTPSLLPPFYTRPARSTRFKPQWRDLRRSNARLPPLPRSSPSKHQHPNSPPQSRLGTIPPYRPTCKNAKRRNETTLRYSPFRPNIRWETMECCNLL